MITEEYKIMSIRLNQEECSILKQALDILKKVNREIDNCIDVDEVRLSNYTDADLLNNIENELNELSCAIEF